MNDVTITGGQSPRWSPGKANDWYARQPWLVGCNFIPSTAINQLEMWQADTFDPATIDRELSWAARLGMNTVRVYLHDLAWQADAEGFTSRIDQFLKIADRHGIRPMLVILDDCWNSDPKVGPQPLPVPSVHNSGWLQSPGVSIVNDPAQWPRLEKYVKGVIGAFKDDPRVLMWDLYNEPGNSAQGDKSLPMLKTAFAWAREVDPSGPLTVAVWFDNPQLNAFQLAASDVITFHNYNDAQSAGSQIAQLKKLGRPVLCTEYMSRPRSTFGALLPVFKMEHVGCYNWGLVSGKTQTIWSWGTAKDAPEPEVWFHDILRKDGTPFDAQEVRLIRDLTRQPSP